MLVKNRDYIDILIFVKNKHHISEEGISKVYHNTGDDTYRLESNYGYLNFNGKEVDDFLILYKRSEILEKLNIA